jgi:hypothetical protein
MKDVRSRGQWSNVKDERACRAGLAYRFSQVEEQKVLSILDMVGGEGVLVVGPGELPTQEVKLSPLEKVNRSLETRYQCHVDSVVVLILNSTNKIKIT